MDVVEERFGIGEIELVISRPCDPVELIDEARFAADEYMPYWAEVWPAGVELARHLATLALEGTRILELGCGIGLPSLVAARRGARVTATDWAPEAIATLRRNAARNGVSLDARVLDWRSADAGDLGTFDLVVAADVLYEERNTRPLLAVVSRAIGAGEALVADPGRRHAGSLLALAVAYGLEIELLPHGMASVDARLLRLRRPR